MKNELNITTGQRLKACIRDKFTGRAWQKDFMKALAKKGLPITQPALSALTSGRARLTHKRAEQFSQILGVSAAYLLGLSQFKDIDAEQDAIASGIMQRKAEARALVISQCVEAASPYGFKILFEFEDKNGIQFYAAKSDTNYHISGNGFSSFMDPEEFFKWSNNNHCALRISDNPKTYVYLKTVHVSENGIYAALTVNEFMRLAYDMKKTIAARIETACSLAGYDYKERFIDTVGFIGDSLIPEQE